MTTSYTTSRALHHPRRPAGGVQGQARTLRALLRETYGAGAVLDRDLVAVWARLVAYWPPAAGQQDQPPQPPSSPRA